MAELTKESLERVVSAGFGWLSRNEKLLLAAEFDTAIREARLEEALAWNAMMKVQDLRVADIQWCKQRIKELEAGQ